MRNIKDGFCLSEIVLIIDIIAKIEKIGVEEVSKIDGTSVVALRKMGRERNIEFFDSNGLTNQSIDLLASIEKHQKTNPDFIKKLRKYSSIFYF